jgi:hypothetical protein
VGQTSVSPFLKQELIASWCGRLAEAFSRNVRDNLVPIWQERLSHFDIEVLKKCFAFIECNDERFPSVARCIRLCRENTPRESDYDYDDKSRYSQTFDKDGKPCIIDMEKKEMLYRAEDCEEGRAFLAKLKEVYRMKEMPRLPSTDDLNLERRRQLRDAR